MSYVIPMTFKISPYTPHLVEREHYKLDFVLHFLGLVLMGAGGGHGLKTPSSSLAGLNTLAGEPIGNLPVKPASGLGFFVFCLKARSLATRVEGPKGLGRPGAFGAH
jgi:hypothetical protein